MMMPFVRLTCLLCGGEQAPSTLARKPTRDGKPPNEEKWGLFPKYVLLVMKLTSQALWLACMLIYEFIQILNVQRNETI